MRSLILLAAVAVVFSFEDCGENSHFESCGTACPLTCENYDNPPKVCILRCEIGCQCDSGYVKNSDGRCVRPEDCPQRAQQNQKTCHEKPESGNCLAYIPRWHYDEETGKCQKFIYGGCGGNGNRYESEEECLTNCKGYQRASTEACDLPAESGVCRGYFQRYYFDRTTGTCKTFIYGGCGGNENNFETIEDCLSTCGSPCDQDKVAGPCRAAFPRYFFNKETGKCEKFIYGGCQGNSNNFLTEEDCKAVCEA